MLRDADHEPEIGADHAFACGVVAAMDFSGERLLLDTVEQWRAIDLAEIGLEDFLGGNGTPSRRRGNERSRTKCSRTTDFRPSRHPGLNRCREVQMAEVPGGNK